ncbi:GroES-like protein [Ganoderma leucocontextum]|nr:GroES-like protein [Ganoderma leucocontextum]
MSAHNKALVQPAPLGQYRLLVKIAAAALNPAGWKIQAWGYYKDSYPIILGFDGAQAGTVEGLGTEVSAFARGNRVIVQAWHDGETKVFHGTFQQYLLVPVYSASKISDSISFEAAAPLFSCVATTAVSLYSQKPGTRSLKLAAPWAGGQGSHAGRSIFIPGGATNVAQFAIQFASLSGFSPIITTASLRNRDLLDSFGATHVVDRTLPSERIVEQVKAIVNGPVDLAYDAVSEESTVKIAGAVLRSGGQLVVVLPNAAEFIKDDIEEKKIQAIQAQGVMSGVNRGALAGLWEKLPEFLEKGLIKSVPYEVLPGGLSAVPAGLERLRNNQVGAVKLVVLPPDTE